MVMVNSLIVFVVGLVFISVLGIAQYRIVNGNVRRRYNSKMFDFFSVVFAFIVSATMAICGGRSLVTYLDAILGADDVTGFYAFFIIAPATILAAGLFTYVILYYTGCKIGYSRKLKLRDILSYYNK